MSLKEEIKETLISLGIQIDKADEHAIDFLIFIGCPVSYIIETVASSNKGEEKGNCLVEVIKGLEKNSVDTRIEALIHGAYYFCSLGFHPEDITNEIVVYMQLKNIINSLSRELSKDEIKSILVRLRKHEPIRDILNDYSSCRPTGGPKI